MTLTGLKFFVLQILMVLLWAGSLFSVTVACYFQDDVLAVLQGWLPDEWASLEFDL